MASQAKVIIKGQNNIGSAVKSAASDLNSMKAAADNPGAALKSAFTFTAILASVKKLGDGLADCFSEFETADRAYKQLSLTIGDDGQCLQERGQHHSPAEPALPLPAFLSL